MPGLRRTARARRLGTLARAALDAPREGAVVGGFTGGVNVLLRDPDTFVPLQAASVPLHPFAVEIEGAPLAVPVGTPVDVEGERIAIGDLRVDLSAARCVPLTLDPLDRDGLCTVRPRLPLLTRSLASTRGSPASDPFETQIAGTVTTWERDGDPIVLLDLVGLGGGSTPSGDDLLVGLIAGLILQKTVLPRARAALGALQSGLRASARDRTPLPSAQSIEAILIRQAPEPLCRLAAALRDPMAHEAVVRRAADRVASLGATSGRFLLAGLACAWGQAGSLWHRHPSCLVV